MYVVYSVCYNKERSLSSVFNSWYIETLHLCIPENGEGESRLKVIAMLIFYAKMFLPSNTTIEAKPLRNERLALQLLSNAILLLHFRECISVRFLYTSY